MAVSQHKPSTSGREPGEPAISSRTTSKMADELNVSSKRQRRPSVRLNEIGDQPAASLSKQWQPTNRGSKTRPLTNLGVNSDNLAIGNWKNKGSKPKKDLKRPRTNWALKKFDDDEEEEAEFEGESENDANNVDENELRFSRDFEVEDSDSSLKEIDPNQDSMIGDKELQFKANTGDNLDVHDDENGAKRLRRKFDGVKVWLEGLGLGRYWPVFEFHEVGEEVLPLLTLEDLKEMGINAVGSRRKMFCAIQKLSEGFS